MSKVFFSFFQRKKNGVDERKIWEKARKEVREEKEDQRLSSLVKFRLGTSFRGARMGTMNIRTLDFDLKFIFETNNNS